MSEHAATSTRPATATPTAVPVPTQAVRRARLRSTVAVAARVLPVHHPLETFIAVNPLAGFEHLGFETALSTAAELYGAPGTLTEDQFRAAHAAGRITDADLDAVLCRRYPAAVSAPVAVLAERGVSALAVLRADLRHGAPLVAPDRDRSGRTGMTPAVARAVDAQTSQWCGAYLAAPDTPWALPGWRDGFFSAWRRLAPRDRTLPREVRQQLARTPLRADDALLGALDALGVSPAEHGPHLVAHLTRMPGFAAHVRWRAEHGRGGVDLVDYLAVRLSYEALLSPSHPTDRATVDRADDAVSDHATDDGPDARITELCTALGLSTTDEREAVARVLAVMPSSERSAVWLGAYEDHYRRDLLTQIDGVRSPGVPAGRRAAAQVVCCIDVRSEGLRRHLEQRGRYDTLGFAGFFAVAISFTDLARGAASALCPALIEPSHVVTEHAEPGTAHLAARRLSGLAATAGADEAFHRAKDGLLTPFALAETAGWAAGPLAAARTLLPRWTGTVQDRWRARVAPAAPTELDIGLSHDDQALFAEVALTTMGLTTGFARLVVLCAHGATTENNPYQASLDCGACGGQPGGPNARTAAAILNDPSVRTHLRARGIDLPADTHVVAAEHDTTTDQVTILDPHLVPQTHAPDLADLCRDLDAAGHALAAERGHTLPGAPRRGSDQARSRKVASRSTDWAQVYPEWGLAGNTAFVVGPRTMTAGLDLQRRVFLHSYDAAVDPDGTALETILTAPMVVAQWISCQYYFSTVAPDVFGAGTKTIHNVLGGVGVLAGHDGDLQLGLPWQSVAHGDRLVHEPMRLFTVVQAPLSMVQSVIDRNPVLARLFGNGWVALAAREDAGAPWQCWTPGGWQPWAGPVDTTSPAPAPATATPAPEETP
jgi:uncharacterized protein YbcC (UPF0753/DUF2309 family)